MSNLRAGFARVNITPMTDIAIAGYFKPRFCTGVLDDLEANVLALEKDGVTVLFAAADLCGFKTQAADRFRKAISKATGVPYEAVFLSATHTHTGPYLLFCSEGNEDEEGNKFEPEYIQKLIDEYDAFLEHRLTDAAKFAIADLKDARMGIAVSRAPGIAFVRRYIMKDGSVRTNPGVLNPDVVRPVGEIDDAVNVLRFDREGADTIVLANFGCHPDVVGGNKISADWPGFFRRTFEKTVDNTKCLFFNGAEGDINHVNVFPKGGDFNDMFNDFDGVSRGYGHARHMGRVVAGAVLQVYDKVEYVDVPSLKFGRSVVQIPTQMPSDIDDIDVATAHKYVELHEAGKDSEIPYSAMMLTTIVAEALRICRLEHGPEFIPMELTAVAIGDVVMFGIPGEPFNGIGKGIKAAEGWKMVCPCCLTNGETGYFPMADSYEEGGYEARSSEFKAGVAELIIVEGTGLIGSLR